MAGMPIEFRRIQLDRKEKGQHILHHSGYATNDGDDAARAPHHLCGFRCGTHARDDGTPAAPHELGRGHRGRRQAAAPHALDSRARKLSVAQRLSNEMGFVTIL
jgi:hypothetical protein